MKNLAETKLHNSRSHYHHVHAVLQTIYHYTQRVNKVGRTLTLVFHRIFALLIVEGHDAHTVRDQAMTAEMPTRAT